MNKTRNKQSYKWKEEGGEEEDGMEGSSQRPQTHAINSPSKPQKMSKLEVRVS